MDPEHCWGTCPGRRDARPPSRPHLSPSDSRTSILGSSQNHLQSLLFSQDPGNPGFQVKMFSRAPRQPWTGRWSQGPSPRPCCPSMAEWGSAAVVLLGEGPGSLKLGCPRSRLFTDSQQLPFWARSGCRKASHATSPHHPASVHMSSCKSPFGSASKVTWRARCVDHLGRAHHLFLLILTAPHSLYPRL